MAQFSGEYIEIEKIHLKIGAKSKILSSAATTPVSTDDGGVIFVLISAANRDVGFDAETVYSSVPIAENLSAINTHIFSREESLRPRKNSGVVSD